MPNYLSVLTDLKRQGALVIIFIAVLIAGYNLSVQPAQQQLLKYKKSNSKIAQNLQTTHNLLTQKTALQNTIKNLAMQDKNNPAFSQEIFLTDLANIAKITKTNLTTAPQNTITKDALNLYPVNLAVTGNYSQLVQFIRLLAQTAATLELTNLTLAPITTVSKSQLSMRATCTVYAMPLAPTTPHQTTFVSPKNLVLRDPFSVSSQNLPLTAWSNNSLQFIGVIKQNTTVWAIIADPNGATHHATLGTPIGLEQSPIIKITADEITAKNPNDNLYRNTE